mmetsp:Transcript_2463/g.5760  ORF Transcript_2463/g.5760 Transcript_2463/m.5760 type:complete len:101 (+) Transcript_2463:87-389(+)
MVEQKERQIEEAKALQASLQEIQQQKDVLEREAADLTSERDRLTARAQELQAKLASVGQQMTDRSMRLNAMKLDMYRKESEYMAFLEAQPSLVHVLRSGQ